MTIHVLVEGPSERAFLEPWSHRLLRGHPVRVHPHQGKGTLPTDFHGPPGPRRRGLLDQLPAKLRAFANSLDAGDGVLVLVDADNDDQASLTASICEMADAVAPHLSVVVQVAVEETEAFYLGDLAAVARAYPDADLEMGRAYEPDSVCGTWELFGRVIGDGGENKVAWAEAMGPRITTVAGRSRSPSFRALLRGFVELMPKPRPAPRKRRWRHLAASKKK